MTIVEAIKKATVGQRVKRRNPSTVSFTKKNMELINISDSDYRATDWVLVVPKKNNTINVGGRTYRVLSTITI